jgi:hypothetical protein
MTDPTPQSAKRNVTRGQRAGKVGKAGLAPLGYVAMHEINAAMCMAGGMLGPRFEEGAARDHHVHAGGLVIEAAGPSKAALSGAVGGLGYGAVVVFEVSMPPQGAGMVPALPLLDARRLVFRTREAADLFCARVSGFGDIPEKAVPIAVAPEYFSAIAELTQPGLLPASGDQNPEGQSTFAATGTTAAANLMRVMDRCAGALLAALGTTREGGRAVDILRGISGLRLPAPDEHAASRLATELAVIADGGPDAKVYSTIFASVAATLCSGVMDAGFSASELQKLAQPESSKGLEVGSQDLKAIESVWSFTKDVLSLRRDVPEGAWSDNGGSKLARGTVFFLLNPEPEQLLAAHARNPNLGPRVYFIAGLLVGLRAGLTRMGKETKEDTGSFLAGAAFAHSWLTKGAALLECVRSWDSNDGTAIDALVYGGRALASARTPGNPRLAGLTAIIRTAGIDARFSQESGALSGRFVDGEPLVTFALTEATLPVFPRIHLHELSATVDGRSSKRDIDKCVEVTNSGTAEHGVSASLVDGPGYPSLRLSVYLAKDISQVDQQNAVVALVTSVRHALDVLPAKRKVGIKAAEPSQ